MRLRMIITVVAIFGFATVALAQKMVVDVDKTTNFAAFKSYSWADGQIAPNPGTGQSIIAAVDRELRSRGLVRNDTDPDIRVSAMAAGDIDVQGVGPSWNNSIYKSWGGYGNPGALMNITKGMLVIDLIETKNKYSIWRGVVKDVFIAQRGGDPAKDNKYMQDLVNKTVGKMFKKYPTKPSK